MGKTRPLGREWLMPVTDTSEVGRCPHSLAKIIATTECSSCLGIKARRVKAPDASLIIVKKAQVWHPTSKHPTPPTAPTISEISDDDSEKETPE